MQVEVEECLVVHKDIDVATGNQLFKGSVKIMGNVQDGMKVHAGGRIDIAGYCSKAEIIAIEHITVKSIIGSTVQAGVKSRHFVACKNNMSQLKEQFIGLTKAYEQLMGEIDGLPIQVRIGHVILALIDKLYKDIPKLLKNVLDNFKTLPIELPDFATRLMDMIQDNIPPLNLTIDKIQEIIDAISLTEEFLFSGRNTANIYTQSILSSNLACTGSIYVQGKGCINSKVFSEHDIFIDNVVRGGLLFAKGNITVGELGSKSGVRVIVKSKEGKITVNKTAHAGVILQIGGFEKSINAETGPIIAYADEEGIIIEPLRNKRYLYANIY